MKRVKYKIKERSFIETEVQAKKHISYMANIVKYDKDGKELKKVDFKNKVQVIDLQKTADQNKDFVILNGEQKEVSTKVEKEVIKETEKTNEKKGFFQKK